MDEFNFDEFLNPPAETPTPAPEVTELQTKLSEAEKKADAAAALAQQNQALMARFQQVFNPQQPVDPVEQFTKNPHAFVENVALQAVQQYAQGAQLRSEYAQKYPDLVPFETEIGMLANNIKYDAQQRGQLLDDRIAVEEAVKQFQTKLEGLTKAKSQQQQQQFMKQNAIQLQPGTQVPKSPGLGSALQAIGNDDRKFAQLRRQMGLDT